MERFIRLLIIGGDGIQPLLSIPAGVNRPRAVLLRLSSITSRPDLTLQKIRTMFLQILSNLVMAEIIQALMSISVMVCTNYLRYHLTLPMPSQAYKSMVLTRFYGIKMTVRDGTYWSPPIIPIFQSKVGMMMLHVSSFCLRVFVMVKSGDHQQVSIIRLKIGGNVNSHHQKFSRVGRLLLLSILHR